MKLKLTGQFSTGVHLDNEFWDLIDVYSTLLKPVEQTHMKFQAENLNYNQFYE
jgi:hypothetical protein